MNLAEQYISGLKRTYLECGAKECWEHFESIICGAGKENIDKLKRIYPDTPDSLVKLLEFVDGTFWKEYNGEMLAFYFLGSDLEEFTYYLLSVNEILEDMNEYEQFTNYANEQFGEFIKIDEKITSNVKNIHWLHFLNCMNNGGSSKLYIDFSPSKKGTKGQVIRYLHDPDVLEVIADSFDQYLQMLIDGSYNFINEDSVQDME